MNVKQTLVAALLICGLASGPLRAADLTLIVDRTADSINLFFGLGADDIGPVFGVAPIPILRDEAGLLRLQDFQTEGSFTDADRLLARSTFTVDGDPADFQAMSMMVHPRDLPVPFSTPIEGHIAMSVCGVPPTFADASDAEVQLYAGFNAYPVKGLERLEITLGGTDGVTLTVLEYHNGELLRRDTLPLSPGGRVTLGVVDAGKGVWWLLSGGMLLALALAGLARGVRGHLRRPRKARNLGA